VSAASLEQRQRSAAQAQALFREINERLRDRNAVWETLLGSTPFVCECANVSCLELIAMKVEEYDAVRRLSNRFLVSPGREHFFPHAERIVDSSPGFVVVEKIGAAGALAADLDVARS
jgi:hypothetical protein